MKIRTLIFTFFLATTSVLEMFCCVLYAGAQPILLDDKPVIDAGDIPPIDYQFNVRSEDHAVVGVRPEAGDDFDLEIYTDISFTTMIESSTSNGDIVDFVVLI